MTPCGRRYSGTPAQKTRWRLAVMLAALLALVRVHAHAEVPLSPTCGSEQCTGSDDAVFGTEFLYDGNTVILAEGTQEEMQEPGWTHRFGMKIVAPDDTCADLGWHQRATPRRVWDAFTFFNELDVLGLRLHTLAPVVHRFVLAEATRTHSNQPKPLFFKRHAKNFSKFLPQIEHIVVEDLPFSTDAWELEHFQRNALVRGLCVYVCMCV